MKSTAQSGYNLAKMIECVEGASSKTALTLSGPMGFHDIINAFSKAHQGIQQREQKDKKREQSLCQ